jgi:hypothetical protein
MSRCKSGSAFDAPWILQISFLYSLADTFTSVPHNALAAAHQDVDVDLQAGNRIWIKPASESEEGCWSRFCASVGHQAAADQFKTLTNSSTRNKAVY